MKLARPLAALLVVVVALVCLRLVAERAGAPERGRIGSDASGGAVPRSDELADVELAAQPTTATRDALTQAELGGTHLVVVDDTGAPVDDARVRWVTADSAATAGEGAALPNDGRYLVLVERDGHVPRADFVDADGPTRFVLQRGARIELRLLGELPEWTRFEALLERAEATDAPSDDEFEYSDWARSRRQRIERALDGAASAKERAAETKKLAKDGAIGSVAAFERLPSTGGRSLVWTALEPGRYRYRVESPRVDGDAVPLPNHTAYWRPYSPTIVAQSGDAFTFDVHGRAPARLTGRFVFPTPALADGPSAGVIEVELMRGVERSWTQVDSVSSPDGTFDFRLDDPADHSVASQFASSGAVWCASAAVKGLAAGEWRDLGEIRAHPTTLRVVFAPCDSEGRALDPSEVLMDPRSALIVDVNTSHDGALVGHEFAFDASRPFEIHGLPPSRAFVNLVPNGYPSNAAPFIAAPFELVRRIVVGGLTESVEIDVAEDVEARFEVDFFKPTIDRALAFRAPEGLSLRDSYAQGTLRDGTCTQLVMRDDRRASHGCYDVYGAQPGSVVFVQFEPTPYDRSHTPQSTLVHVSDASLGGAAVALHEAAKIRLAVAEGSALPDAHFEFAAPGSDTWLAMPIPLGFGSGSGGFGYQTMAWCLPLGWRVRSVDGTYSATLPMAAPLGEVVTVELVRKG